MCSLKLSLPNFVTNEPVCLCVRIMSLPQSDVRRLDDVSTHLRRGDSVLAVFPETTSFYAAVVYKAPKAMAHSGPGAGANSDVVVKVSLLLLPQQHCHYLSLSMLTYGLDLYSIYHSAFTINYYHQLLPMLPNYYHHYYYCFYTTSTTTTNCNIISVIITATAGAFLPLSLLQLNYFTFLYRTCGFEFSLLLTVHVTHAFLSPYRTITLSAVRR